MNGILVTLAVLCATPALAQAAEKTPARAFALDAAFLDVVLVPTGAVPSSEALFKRLKKLQRPGLSADVTPVPRASVPGLDEETLPYVTTKLPEDARKQFAAAQEAFALSFEWKPNDPRALRDIYVAVGELAKAHKLLIFDSLAMDAFDVERWNARRVNGGWNGKHVTAPLHFNVHLVPADDNLMMLDTGGLPRFGVPDVVITGVSRHGMQVAGDFLNVLAQRLVEGARPDAKGHLRLRLADLKEPSLRKRVEASSYENAKGELTVRLAPSTGKGEVRAEAWEVHFPREGCATQGECLEAGLGKFFGWKDNVVNVEHDAKVLAAKARALEQLRPLQPLVQKGLPQGEVLLVKARFPHDEGNEWMWVEVQSWKNGKLRGRLQSQPHYVKELQAGAEVSVPFSDLMDYMHVFEDGSFRGNETGKVLQPALFEDAGNGRSRIKR